MMRGMNRSPANVPIFAEQLETRLLLSGTLNSFDRAVPAGQVLVFDKTDFVPAFSTDPLKQIEILSLPAHGTLYAAGVGNSPAAVGSVLTVDALAGAYLQYKAADGYNGPDQFTWTADFGGGWLPGSAAVNITDGSVTTTTPPTAAPPSAVLTTPGTVSGNVPISYTLTDAQAEACTIQVQFSIDGGATWRPATGALGGDGTARLVSSSGGTSHTYLWNSLANIGTNHKTAVQVRITPKDAHGTGAAAATGNFTVDNNTVPVATLTTPVGTKTGNVTISYVLADAQSDTCGVLVEYSADNGSTWHTATAGTGGDGTSGLASSLRGTAHTFVWDSKADMGTGVSSAVKIRITPSDTAGGVAKITGAFRVDDRWSTSNAAFVDSLYRGLLFRAPTAAELNGYVAQLSAARPLERAQLVTNLGTSAEFKTYVAPIIRLYEQLLGREPDSSGMQTYVTALRRLTPLTTIVKTFLTGTEFIAKYGDIYNTDTPTQFVDWAYPTILGHAPTSATRTNWIAWLTPVAKTPRQVTPARYTREYFVWNLLTSAENVNGTANKVYVSGLYSALFQRTATAGELTAGANALSSRAKSFLQVAQDLLASSELRI